jgi:hypothetical protein
MAWDSSGVVIGLCLSEPTDVVVEFDARFNGWWHGNDNVLLTWHPEPDTVSIRVMDTTPEARAFREKETGYAVEGWDDSAAYIAAFGHLVQPSAVRHGSRRVPSGGIELEMLLPSEPRIGFRPSPGDTIGLAIHFPQVPATLLERYELGPFVLE